MLERINLIDITMEQDSYESIINKAGRVVDGTSHGRTVLKGDGGVLKGDGRFKEEGTWTRSPPNAPILGCFGTRTAAKRNANPCK